MPVRYPAPCRHTLPRAPAALNSGIWVTDSMLCQAIERYCRVFVAPCRHLSSHTGPLESRRRLGRRHMTGLMQMPSSSAYRQNWHFEVASVPGLWHWEPPTATKDRQKLTAAGLFNKFIAWLEQSDAAQPFLQPPADATVAYAAPAEALAEQTIIPETIMQESAAPLELPQGIIELRATINSAETINDEMLYKWFNKCRRSLRRSMRRGPLSDEGILLAMDPLDPQTMIRISNSKVADKIIAMIRRAVLFSINSQSDDTAPILQELWKLLTDRMHASRGENQYVVLIWILLGKMPSQIRDKISADELLDLTHTFVTAQANMRNTFSHWFSRTAQYAALLEKLNATQRQSLVDSMQLSLLQGDTSTKYSQRLQYSWWVIRANGTSLSYDGFVAVCRKIMTAGLRLNSMRVWQLLTARVVSNGLVEEAFHKELMETDYTSLNERWCTLVKVLLASSSGDAGVQEVCVYLKSMGQMDTLTRALTSPSISYLDMYTVRKFATACNDHRLALQVFEAVQSKDETGIKSRGWGWASWDAYVERMVKDPELDQAHVWWLLNLARKSSTYRSTEEVAKEVEAKSQLLDKMSWWYLEAEHLTERQRLRNIQRCVSCQRSLTTTVPLQTLASVAELVTRDLEQGRWGRTERMEWMVRMVAMSQGERSANGAAEALKGWRAVINRYRP